MHTENIRTPITKYLDNSLSAEEEKELDEFSKLHPGIYELLERRETRNNIGTALTKMEQSDTASNLETVIVRIKKHQQERFRTVLLIIAFIVLLVILYILYRFHG